MIYKIVAVIGVIFLIIFGLVVYSALTLPAKTLVRVTSVSTQQAVTAQPAGSASLPAAGPAAQFRFAPGESRTPAGEAFSVDETYLWSFSGPSTYTLLQIPPASRFSNRYSPLNLSNRV